MVTCLQISMLNQYYFEDIQCCSFNLYNTQVSGCSINGAFLRNEIIIFLKWYANDTDICVKCTRTNLHNGFAVFILKPSINFVYVSELTKSFLRKIKYKSELGNNDYLLTFWR